jgi:predicted nucleic acid-binding protein
MAEQWVVNASPLIVLARIQQQQHLLTKLADEVVVPQAVVAEIQAGPVDDPARLSLSLDHWPVVDVVSDPLIQAWDLGHGETAVLSHALQNPAGRPS